MARACNICGVSSDAAPFYKGVQSRCAACHRAAVAANRRAKADYYQAYDFARANLPHRVALRAAITARLTREKRHEYQLNSIAKHPERRAARLQVQYAVKAGRMERKTTCEDCGASGRIHAHHDDYSKPLDVRWLCQRCHREAHAVMGAWGRGKSRPPNHPQ